MDDLNGTWELPVEVGEIPGSGLVGLLDGKFTGGDHIMGWSGTYTVSLDQIVMRGIYNTDASGSTVFGLPPPNQEFCVGGIGQISKDRVNITGFIEVDVFPGAPRLGARLTKVRSVASILHGKPKEGPGN